MVEVVSKFVSFVQFNYWMESWGLWIFEVGGRDKSKLSLMSVLQVNA